METAYCFNCRSLDTDGEQCRRCGSRELKPIIIEVQNQPPSDS